MSKNGLKFPKIGFGRQFRSPEAPLGIVDIGSNSVRLVAFGGSARSPVPIYNEKIFCKLGESVAATGRIEGASLDLTLATLKRFHAIGKRLGIADYRVVATAAVREAENRDNFVKEASLALGTDIQVISGQMEAKYAAKGVMMGFEKVDGVVADLGGGSLELVRVVKGEIIDAETLPLGVLRLTAEFGDNKDQMAAHIKEQISSLKWLKKSSDKPVYMVGGTWRALARIHMAQKNYDLKMLHHYQLRSADILDFSRLIGNLSPESVEHIHEANAVRRPYLPVSALVLYRITKLTGCNKLIVSANGLREGIIYNSLSTALKDKDPLMVACEDISKRMTKDPKYGAELQQWTAGLFNGQGLSPKKLTKYNRLRNAACLIGDMAWNQHNDYRCWFAANTILRAPLNCINHKGRRFLAHTLYTRHNGSQSELPLGMHPVDDTTLTLSRSLGLAFRLAHCLSGSLHGLINDTRLSRRGRKLVFEMDAGRRRLYGPIVEKRVCALADSLNLEPEIYIGAEKIHLG
ncbi:hypothetical protein IMCC14465_02380 [alpha proteobacterium IMCC14465]|uniref:Uncharacterized protein n=1 Tax=alpha proteobacterium IMCC14465 TaxID=1220535 RepID=J9E1Q0_9PROT|nr:hypothetical protein IMCC14465_02380 [alpha proteobacterium IMCC14465]